MKFFKSALYVLAANAAVLAISFLLRPFAARFLGPSEYGLFALALSTATVIPAFTLFSLNSGVLYYAAKTPGKKKQIVSSVLAFTLAASLVLFLPLQYAILALAPTLGFFGYAAAFALSLATSFFIVLQAAQQGLERFAEYSKYSVASSLAAGLLSLAVAYALGSGFLAALARAAAVFVVSLYGLLALKAVDGFDLREFKKIARYAAPLGVAGLVAAFIVVVDRYFLAAFRGTAEVGFYDIAYAMTAAVLPFSGALLTTMMPRLIKQQKNIVFYHKKLGHANTLVLSAIGLFFFYYSDVIVTLLLGSSFAPAAAPFKILAFALPLMAFYGLNGASLDATAKTKVSGVLAALLTVFSVAFNFLLVPAFGAVGAACANFLCYAVIVGAGFYYLKTRRGIELRDSARQYAVFIAFAVFYLAFLEKGGFAFKTVAFAVFLIASFVANKALAAEMIDRGRSLVKNKA